MHALFRYADPDGVVALRSFFDDASEVHERVVEPIAGGLDELIKAACAQAIRCAQHPRPTVFCPPIATFVSGPQAREQELVARVSGQDLALMGRAEADVPPETLLEQARQLRGQLQAPMLIGTAEVLPRCRIGLAMFPGDGQDGPLLLEAAEKACMLADEAGGVAFARPEAHAHALREMQMASALRHALERQELRLVYQPQVSLSTGAIVGLEALARWRSPQWGEVPPTEFIGVAERTGLISELGHWVLETACRQWVSWRAAGLSAPRVAINVSPHQLRRGDLALSVQRVLLDTGMDPRGLGIELTESAVMDDPTRAGQALTELRAPYERYASSGEINTTVDDIAEVIGRIASLYGAHPQDRLDGLTVDCGSWWFNVRPSNTEPLLRLNLEAATRDECDTHVAELLAVITA